eukprot:TRINITY_DN80039_c0_g1_i1.p1 TRINITY_DN80039_c0_g1~~TRINITY_DN80039_c0_g1_i1.p1  ORF type:complete len:232 (+),score=46.41 TRINITY_DN80039_c0_g1_i1:93-698(+)
MAAVVSNTPAASANWPKAVKCYKHIAKCAAGAFLMSAIVVVLGGQPQNKAGLLRSEPWTQQASLAARQVREAAAAEAAANRKPLMRKERPLAPTVAAPRPPQWGGMMRKEAAKNITGTSAPRPQEWGSMMRREAAPAAPVVPASAAEETAAPEGERRKPTKFMMVSGVVVACLSLIGFALQLKGVVQTLIQAAAPDSLKGK